MLTNPSPKSILKKYPSGGIFQLFGENPEDYKPLGYDGHPGIDLVAYEGAPLVAVCDATVQEVALDPFRLGGKAVWLYSNGVRWGYGHLKDIWVRPDDEVKAGQQIGTMGNTGFVVSDAKEYWGNAPTGKGVHCHLSKMFVKMVGRTPQVLNSDNGFQGFVNPLPDLVQGSMKAEVPAEYTLLVTIRDLLRSIITKLGYKPIA
jgi:hypothetical protein